MFEVKLSRQVDKYLRRLEITEHERCVASLKQLRINPFKKRAGCDVKKKSGNEEGYRLRVGGHRFNYWIDGGKLVVAVDEAFRRGRGYR